MGRGADETLAGAAVAGDSDAFAELYDRHERRAFNLAYRITGTREDAADATQEAFLKVLARMPRLAGRKLDFGNYLLTAVRHASYDVLASCGRAEPTGDLPDSARPVGGAAMPPPEEDPGRGVLLAAQQEEIRAANASLPPRQRAVLALRELEGFSYDEIAAEMGMNRNSVAQLISRARIGLRDALRRTALLSIAPATAACEQALALVAMRDDGERVPGLWLDGHLESCETCNVAREAMAEAGASYRAWAPITALEVLRRDTIARAGDRLGHDWGQLPAAGVQWAPRGRLTRARVRARARFGRDAVAAAAFGVVMLLVLLSAYAQDGAVDAGVEPVAPAPVTPSSSAAPAVHRAGAAAPRPQVAARRAQAPAPVRVSAPAPAAANTIKRTRSAAKPAGRPARRKAAVVQRGPVAAVTPPAIAPPPPPVIEDRRDEEVVPAPQPPLPQPPPPPPVSTATNFVATPPPPPPSTRPKQSPGGPSGGSSGVPVP